MNPENAGCSKQGLAIEKPQPLLISFSGLDGSGKSTQIANLLTALGDAGIRTRLLTFWDNVVVAAGYREGFVHHVYKSERGIGAPGKPVNRRDKNMRGWHLTLARHALYLADAINLRRIVAREKKSGAQVIVLDRYIYDELANLGLQNPFSRMFVRAIQAFTPKPDVAYLLDADPARACERKPEYPLEFTQQARRMYFELANLLGTLTIIPGLSLPEVKAAVLRAVEDALGRRLEIAAETTGYGLQGTGKKSA